MGTWGLGVKFLVFVFRRLARAESGATSLEYALLASLIGVVIIGAVTALGPLMDDKFTTLTEALIPTDDPASPRPPPDLVIANPVNPAGGTTDLVADTGTSENPTGGTLGHTGGKIHTVGRAEGSVTISAADLLAAARGSGLSAKPAAGPADGIQISQTARPAISANSPEPSAQNPDNDSATKRSPMPPLKISSVALDTRIQRPSPNDINTENDSNFLSGPQRLVMGLFALLAALLALVVVIWKVAQRARLYSDRKSQLSEWRENSGNQQKGESGEAISQEIRENT